MRWPAAVVVLGMMIAHSIATPPARGELVPDAATAEAVATCGRFYELPGNDPAGLWAEFKKGDSPKIPRPQCQSALHAGDYLQVFAPVVVLPIALARDHEPSRCCRNPTVVGSNPAPANRRSYFRTGQIFVTDQLVHPAGSVISGVCALVGDSAMADRS